MNYEQQLELTKTSLISYCKECVVKNWNKMFDMWLSCDADMEFGHGYQDIFKKQFNQHINSQIEEQLWFAGKNIVFAICAFRSYKDNTTLEDIVDFVEIFVLEQLNDFDNWCILGQLIYEQSSEYQQEDCATKEETSS